VIYNFLSVFYNIRIQLKVELLASDNIASLTDVFPGANWYEREVWDMFGIIFENHPDLRRILTDYGFDGFPLRKDFPLLGFIEVRYCEIKKKLIFEPVQLSQEYRKFDFQSSWPSKKTLILKN
jgi:NADH-quinone oxidoreductase subunit C